MTIYFDYLKDELANTANKIIDAFMGSNVKARDWAYERFIILIDDELAKVISSQEAEIDRLKREIKEDADYYQYLIRDKEDIIKEKDDLIEELKYGSYRG
jgi:vacuolar-type H+-ATPase subunit I/STV1